MRAFGRFAAGRRPRTDRSVQQLEPAPAAPRRGALRCLVWALVTVAMAFLVYLHGMLQTFTMDAEEHCTLLRGQPFDPRFGRVSLWPPSRRCNAGFDMVASWVTPTVVGLLVATLLLLAAAVRVRLSRPRASRAGRR